MSSEVPSLVGAQLSPRSGNNNGHCLQSGSMLKTSQHRVVLRGPGLGCFLLWAVPGPAGAMQG